jgi:hypothetical protein
LFTELSTIILHGKKHAVELVTIYQTLSNMPLIGFHHVNDQDPMPQRRSVFTLAIGVGDLNTIEFLIQTSVSNAMAALSDLNRLLMPDDKTFVGIIRCLLDTSMVDYQSLKALAVKFDSPAAYRMVAGHSLGVIDAGHTILSARHDSASIIQEFEHDWESVTEDILSVPSRNHHHAWMMAFAQKYAEYVSVHPGKLFELRRGCAVFHRIVFDGCVDCVRALLPLYRFLTFEYCDGKTPFDVAFSMNRNDLTAIIPNPVYEIVEQSIASVKKRLRIESSSANSRVNRQSD